VTRTILIDADIVAFKGTSANQQVFKWDENTTSVAADFDTARDYAAQLIEEYRVKLAADRIVVCLSDPDLNFRKDVYPLYKSKRDPSKKPVYLQQLKDWFKDQYETYQRPKLEADDCMGILSTHPTLIKGEKIIVSEDKDMQTIPGLLFNPRKDKKPRKISQLFADRYHMTQTITGDTTDGYPGAPGIGPKSEEVAALQVARSVREMWGIVLRAFGRSKALAGQDHAAVVQAAIVQARCARILRAGDWEFKQKRPLLWCPPLGEPGGASVTPRTVGGCITTH
jgi:DNA polymerase-1